jgi:hypothetical protein
VVVGIVVLAALMTGCTSAGTSAVGVTASLPSALPPVAGSPTRPVARPAPSSTPPSVRSRPSATPSATRPSAGSPAPAALARLAGLTVKGRAPKTGYDRDLFGPDWTDDNDAPGGHNGCDTRNDVLRRDLSALVIKAGTHGCLVLAGTLHDPYTGKVVDFVRGPESIRVQIDHVVALSDAWQKGAQRMSRDVRVAFANDPLELLAVDGPTNAAKGDGDAATWLPPNKPFRCAYVARQIAVKAKYGLWVTPAERDAMARVLAACPGQPLPHD